MKNQKQKPTKLHPARTSLRTYLWLQTPWHHSTKDMPLSSIYYGLSIW